MFHVLIVDDESFSVEAILCAIDWKSLNVDQVFSAYDMKTAKSIFEKHRIDVMLCDIEMPKGSGIELASWVKEHSPKTVNLFLTCHADFKYAQEAIVLGAFDYLLKPMEYDKLQEHLAHALEEYQRRMDLKAYKDKWTIHHEIVEDKFWSDLLLGKSDYTSELLLQDAAKKDIFLSVQTMYLPVLVRVQNYQELLHSWYGNDLDFAFRNIAHELFDLEDFYTAIAATSSDEKVILLCDKADDTEKKLSSAEFFEMVRRQIVVFSKTFQKYFHAKLSLVIGRPVSFELLTKEYQRLSDKADHAVFQDTSTPSKEFFADSKFSEFRLKVEEWTSFIFSNRPDLLLAEFHRCFSKDLKRGMEFYDLLVQAVFIELLKRNISAYTIFSDERLQTSKNDRTPEKMDRLLQNLCLVIFEKTQQVLLNDTIVDQLKFYITQNLTNNLSREYLARQFFINPDYLSRLFKKETGSSLQDYILKERIKKAKFLLETTNLSISEVHEQSGFSNSSYFSKVFKRETEMTPQEYRQREK